MLRTQPISTLFPYTTLFRSRTGDNAGALTIVNQLRLKRGATAMASITLSGLLDERQRELYADGWRRQDLIRYGVYLQPWGLKDRKSTRLNSSHRCISYAVFC